MGTKTRSVNDIAAWCGIIWFVLIIDACFTWFLSYAIRDFIGSFFIFYSTFLIYRKHQLVVSKHRLHLFLFIFILFFFMLFFHGAYISGPFTFLPLMCIVLWNMDVLFKMYQLFRNFIIFYAILSIIVELFVLSGIWTSLPHIVMPAQDTVQESFDTVNYVYGVFCIPVDNIPISFYRACGPLREGGHFSVFLGFLYFVEKIVYSRRNIWLIVCGFLTLSPNFVLFLLVTEGYYAIINKKIMKTVAGLFFVFIAVIMAFVLSPQNIKDEIIRIVIERTLEDTMNNAQYDGFMALLDGRTNTQGLLMYEQFSKNASFYEHLFGYNYAKLSLDFVLSDIRYLIVRYGYVGISLFLICTYFFSVGSKTFLYGLALFLLAFGVMLQRAWMFEQVYIWVMMFLATNAKLITVKSNR